MINEHYPLCPICGSAESYTKLVPPHVGLYCSDCHTWIKWIAQNNPIDVMPYGKYRGIPIKELPDHYLNWCIENFDISSKIWRALKKESDSRKTKS